MRFLSDPIVGTTINGGDEFNANDLVNGDCAAGQYAVFISSDGEGLEDVMVVAIAESEAAADTAKMPSDMSAGGYTEAEVTSATGGVELITYTYSE